MATLQAEKGVSEDWLSVWIGLLIFVLSLGVFVGVDILGWGVTTAVWTDLGKALAPVSKAYAGLGGIGALVLTYLFLLVVMTLGATALRADLGKFIAGFSFVFWASYLCWIIGSWAYIAATADKLKIFGISWSLNLTAEAGFLVALIAGLVVGNLFPGLVEATREAIRPEWYIKTAIVILGGFLGVTAAEKLGLATAVMFRGLCAIIEAYLIYWAVVYFVSRKYFKLSREWAAPLASGISICGVSAAIATAAAIKARPIVPIMISSLVVVFSCVELVILPFAAQAFLYTEPMVAGAWMGLAVKTDGAAVASGAITDALIRAKALAVQGARYLDGRHHDHRQSLHRHLHRRVGVHPGRHLDDGHRASAGGAGQPAPDLEPLPEVRHRLRDDLPRRPADRPSGAAVPGQGQGGDGRGQRLQGHLLRDDLLHHRRPLQLRQAVGGGPGQAGGDLPRMPVRLHRLDRAPGVLGVLPRCEAAAGGGTMARGIWPRRARA
jgi:hypothetical protein